MTEGTSLAPHGADSEVGRLRTVMLHRPGPELKRLTPRNNDKLLFDGIPWVRRAQDEHDAFAAALRDRDVEVLYLTDLLTETLERRGGPRAAIDEALRDLDLGDTMRGYLEGLLGDARRPSSTTYLTAGIRNDEVRGGFGLVTACWPTTTSSSTRCPTCCSPATPACGCATGSRSPRWRCRPASARPS